MKVYSILILNKAGGLIYQNELVPGLSKLSANDYLVLAGTLHGVHAIGSKLSSTINSNNNNNIPNGEELNAAHNATILSTGKAGSANSNRTGLQKIETDMFNLYIFQTVSGLKFIMITAPNVANSESVTDELFRHLYILYSDYVMKDPFYSLDMPIKSSLFDGEVKRLFAQS
ncbi:synbindin, putative [Candida dubliniensis CD36]|uniref:Trafficking protein particle complex subunit n=1 Tax=Candida dubliniensis (strain CD36 / ATCC MYA-646 / CBS 7987 / NCPF 3949 / NRRL Y-17841) TaxID=573826 RepID=B9W703_CANDC|nr:synbindin, putative [Candida dubliniensis CD36]CAX44461.1 synbindin, putative [Candida dubliniensis CD36]